MSVRFASLAVLALAAVPAQAQEMDHSAHAMSAPEQAEPGGDAAPTQGEVVVGHDPAPPLARDFAADAYFDPAEMAKVRKATIHEVGGMPASMLLLDKAEWRPGPGGDGYSWSLKGWWGGDINRFAIESKGEGAFGGKAETVEVLAGFQRALDPWFNLRAGVRQDLGTGPRRTHAALTIEGLAPYWFDVEGSVYLSDKGELTARAEASYDQRLTQRLILQPSLELNISAQDMPTLETGAGFTTAEAGLRLRYEMVREFAPYVGVNWERKLGQTARYARADGENPEALRFVAGIRFWF